MVPARPRRLPNPKPENADTVFMAIGDYSAHSGGLAGVLDGMDLLAPAADLGNVTSALAHILDLPVGEILPVVVAGAPMVVPMLNELLATREPTLLAVFLTSRDELESVVQTLAHFLGKDRRVGTAMVCSV